jgi:N-acetylated-alpha-linked acidic dipeptidase
MDCWELARGVQADTLLEHLRRVSVGARISGSADEAAAFDYIEQTLGGLGYSIKREQVPALIGYPLDSTLEVLGPERLTLPCNGYSLTPSTPPEGIEGDLVYVGMGVASDYQGKDVRGKIVLSDGLATPAKVAVADGTGAMAQIHVNDERTHEMCVSSVWGPPTPRHRGELPRMPAIAVTADSGRRLRSLAEAGNARVRIRTRTYLDWTAIPLLTADLAGAEDLFVLFSAHVDSWHQGAMDNGSGNAIQLLVGQLLAKHRTGLRRGVRLAFWSGHSHGRYAGSTWYADHHWQELYERCAVHVNVDSVGGMGAEILSDAPTMAETYGLAGELIRKIGGQELDYRRMGRAGDQSFWGIGVSSMFDTLSQQPASGSASAAATASLSGGGRRSGGFGWWWHTTEDTVDKIDPEKLLRDARIYVAGLWRLCTDALLPLDLAATANELAEQMQAAQAAARRRLDLSEPIDIAKRLARDIEALDADASRQAPVQANALRVRLSRELVPIGYTAEGRFDHDPALTQSPLPGLAGCARLGEVDENSDEYHMLLVEMTRQRNRIVFGLSNAARLVAEALSTRRPAHV